MEGIRKVLSEGRTSGCTNSTKEFQAGLTGLQKRFSSRLDAVKISPNKQIQEAVTEASNDICRTGDTISDIEKSITALSESDEFIQPRNPVRQKNMISVNSCPSANR